MIEALFVAALAVLNRVRGGGFGAEHLPGHPRFYVAPAVALLSLLVVPWPAAILAGVCYLAWSMLPWGRWFDLGRLATDPPRRPSQFENGIELLFDTDLQRFTARNLVAFLPAAILLTPFAAPAAFVQTLLYEVAWRLSPSAPIRLAEILTGALWGVLILMVNL